MSTLPEMRVTPAQPAFSSVGIDHFGPIFVKVKRTTVKRYGCVFTCLTMRAVHIEIAHDLSTDSFIQSFVRFVSRRGAPTQVFSDNGTNFKGAEKEISQALNNWNQNKIMSVLRNRGVAWNFNPPSASHTGGIWERIIRSIRKILRSILGDQLVDDETLLTVMAEIEKILNDRPLTRLTNDPNDLCPLTPSQLLLLRPNASVPLTEFEEVVPYRKRWKQSQYLANIFWKRWLKEYLPTLQERQKWLRPKRNFKVGDLVLIVHENVHRGQWPKGLVEEVFPDKYGNVRQVTIRTASSRVRRDVCKICLVEDSL